MPLKSLQDLMTRVDYDTLPPSWNTFDLARFSADKSLWDYQQAAVRLAITALFKYYEDFADYSTGEDAEAGEQRRVKLVEWYEDGMVLSPRERKTLNLSLAKAKLALRNLLADYYAIDEDAPELDFTSVCNRMGFWMATGSGKTIVLVKLLEVLHGLMQRQEIPVCDVLMLTHREDLIEQFQMTITEFNRAPGAPVRIELCELRQYPEAKREAPGGLFGAESTLRVFYYRSDNLSDDHKERIVDFRNYDNNGRWYVLLDEAHKGDSEDSKRKQIYAIMTRAGFLFNFSATFTDVLDLATTVHNFNLSEFITEGYGKHIAVLKQELAAFRRRPETADYTDEEKRKVVAKSMLLLAYTAQQIKNVRKAAGQPSLYHLPMLLALVNSVNTDDADLQIYFEQILAIGRGDLPELVWAAARDELWEELKDEPAFLYEDRRVLQIAEKDIKAIGPADVWREVYNLEAEGGGEIEVLVRPGNRQEIAFKMKASSRPFALIKIGDITDWLREKLTGFDYVETLETESFFTGLNAPDSSINILMGSRSFYEGWDSNRPNVINFVNIGVGEDAKKFILQSVGRGVRIQSWQDSRRRLEELHTEFDDRKLFRRLRDICTAPETLYVLGTKREALRVVLQELKKEQSHKQQNLLLELNTARAKHVLLVPEYVDKGSLLVEHRIPSKFEISTEDFRLLEQYVAAIPNDRVLLARHGARPKSLKHLRGYLKDSDAYFAKQSTRSYRNLDVMVNRVISYFGLTVRELECLRDLTEDDIVHFRHMTVDHDHATELQKLVDQALHSRTPEGEKEIRDIEVRYKQGEFDLPGLVREMQDRGLSGRESYKGEVVIDATANLANHYYLPILSSSMGRRLEYLRHIIDVESEVNFLHALQKCVAKADCPLRHLNWWMFSKLDQYLDSPFIPYYDPKQNRDAKFKPDFIFWGQRGNRYRIMFVDPKGMENIDWERKAEGYMRHYEAKKKPKVFNARDLKVEVLLYYYTRDRNHAAEGDFKRFWSDSVKTLCEALTGTTPAKEKSTPARSHKERAKYI